MTDLYSGLDPQWAKHPGASREQLRQAEIQLARSLPDDYTKFLTWSDGGEGHLAGRYLMLWSTEELMERNRAYMIDHYLPGRVGIGTDGGSRCYLLDYTASQTHPPIVACDLGDLAPDAVVKIAETFRDFILPAPHNEVKSAWAT